MPNAIDPNVQVSHEQDGRILSGMGVSQEALAETMDRHTPESTETSRLGTAVAPAADAQTDSVTPASEPPLTRGRQRFSDLTKERDSAKAETATERTKREGLEREIADLRTQLQRPQSPQQAADTQQQLQQATQQQAAQRFTFPSFESFAEQHPTASYDDWQDAKDDARYAWRKANDPDLNIDQRVGQFIDRDRTQRSFVETVSASHAKGRSAYKDFDAMLSGGPGALIPLGPAPHIAVPRAQYVINHPQSEHLQYAILKDGDLARRLQAASDLDFGAILASLVQPAAPVRTQAFTPTAPYQPVGSGSGTVTPSSADIAQRGGQDYDKSGYREKRAAERNAARGRR